MNNSRNHWEYQVIGFNDLGGYTIEVFNTMFDAQRHKKSFLAQCEKACAILTVYHNGIDVTAEVSNPDTLSKAWIVEITKEYRNAV